MAQAVIAQKLESLRRCVARIASRCPATAAKLHQDIDAQDILSLNLSRAIQLCVDIAAHWLVAETKANAPQAMGQAFLALAQAGKLDEDLAQRLRNAAPAAGCTAMGTTRFKDIALATMHACFAFCIVI